MTDPVIRHGWTNDSVRRLAYRVARSMPVGIMTLRERQDVAYFRMLAKLLTLVEDDPEPTSTWLWNWGRQAIGAAVEKELREHGYSVKSGGPMRGYFTWWAGPGRTKDEHEDKIIEPIAIHQVMDGLSDRDRQTLEAVAYHGHVIIAAEAMGWSRGTAYERLRRARHQAKLLWSYPDPPAKQWAHDPPLGTEPQPIGEYLAERRYKHRKAAA